MHTRLLSDFPRSSNSQYESAYIEAEKINEQKNVLLIKRIFFVIVEKEVDDNKNKKTKLII